MVKRTDVQGEHGEQRTNTGKNGIPEGIISEIIERAHREQRTTIHCQPQCPLLSNSERRITTSAEALGRIYMTPDETQKLGRAADDNVLVAGEWVHEAQRMKCMGDINRTLIAIACDVSHRCGIAVGVNIDSQTLKHIDSIIEVVRKTEAQIALEFLETLEPNEIARAQKTLEAIFGGNQNDLFCCTHISAAMDDRNHPHASLTARSMENIIGHFHTYKIGHALVQSLDDPSQCEDAAMQIRGILRTAEGHGVQQVIFEGPDLGSPQELHLRNLTNGTKVKVLIQTGLPMPPEQFKRYQKAGKPPLPFAKERRGKIPIAHRYVVAERRT